MVLRKATSEVIRHQGRWKVPSANSCAIDLLVILNTTGKIRCCNAGYYLQKNTAPVSARFQLWQKCWTKRRAISTWRHIPRDGGWCQPAAQGGQEDAAEGGPRGYQPSLLPPLPCLGPAAFAKAINAGAAASQVFLKNISAYSIEALGQKPESCSAVSVWIKRKN